jgi:hypothetical protein
MKVLSMQRFLASYKQSEQLKCLLNTCCATCFLWLRAGSAACQGRANCFVPDTLVSKLLDSNGGQVSGFYMWHNAGVVVGYYMRAVTAVLLRFL